MAKELKVGSQVRVNTPNGFYHRLVGVVTMITGVIVYVRFGEEGPLGFMHTELKVIQ